MKSTPVLRSLFLGSALLAAVTTSHSAAAAVIIWSGDGTDANWSTSENWSDGLPAGSDAVFAEVDETGTTGP